MGQVVVFTGLPGTGKSTLAEEVGRRGGVPVFAGDWLMGALKPHGVLAGLGRAEFLAMYCDLLETLAGDIGAAAVDAGAVGDRGLLGG